MTNSKRFMDGYERVFNNLDDLVEEILKMEETTGWIPGVISKEITISAIEPIEAQEVADATGIPYDVVFDTAENTQLVMEYGGKKFMLRDTAIDSILETAKINGKALSRMSPFLLAEVLNRCLTVARGDSLLLVRGNKVCACLSDNIYKIMPIERLINITVDALNEKFGTPEFIKSDMNYSFTSAMWELPDAQEKLLEVYNQEVELHKRRFYGRNFMPAVRFVTSDVGKYAATLIPLFKMGNGAYFRINSGIRVAHKRGTGNNLVGIEAYETEAKKIFAKFCDFEKTLGAMSRCCLQHPLNAFIGMCKKANIPRKYVTDAYDELQAFTGGTPCYMDEVYLAIAGSTGVAQKLGVRGQKLLDLEESVAKLLSYKWEEFDIGGVVAW